MRARFSLIFIFWMFLFAVIASAEPLRLVRIDAENARALASELEGAGYDVLRTSVTETSLELVVSTAEMEALQRQGYAPATLALGRPFADIQSGRLARELIIPGYPTLTEIVNRMNRMAEAAPTICKIVDLTTAYNVPPTVEGRHLFAVKISDNVTLDEDEPAFLMVSGHHSREIVTPVLALYAIDRLTALYGSDPAVTRAVDENEIWIAPVWNPDGYDYVFNQDNLWRKNRRVFPSGIGVDLNRNYPFGWHNPCSGSDQPSSNQYKGPEPASEAETKTMIAWSRDRHFAEVLDYHSSGREVLHGYRCWSHPVDHYLQQSAAALSVASGYGGRIRPPSADGENYQWQLAVRGTSAFLTETHIEYQPPYESAVSEAALLWPATLWLLERPFPLWGHVTDASTGAAVNATIRFLDTEFLHGEVIASGGPFGRYHAFFPAGTYRVVFEAKDYRPVTVTGVVVSQGGSTRLDVRLTRAVQSQLTR